MPSQKKTRLLGSCCAGVTIPELVQSKAAVLSTLASTHSRRSYKHAIERFIHWYCSEPRPGFNSQSDYVHRPAASVTPWAAHGNEVNVPGLSLL
jgi:hypothetical protein